MLLTERKALKKYGRNVRAERVKAGLTQAELGEKVGVRKSNISDIELGKSWSSQWVYFKLTKVLGVGRPPLMG